MSCALTIAFCPCSLQRHAIVQFDTPLLFWDELLQLQEKFLRESLQQCGLQCKLAKELIPYSAAMMSAVSCELCVLAPAFTVAAHTLLPYLHSHLKQQIGPLA